MRSEENVEALRQVHAHAVWPLTVPRPPVPSEVLQQLIFSLAKTSKKVRQAILKRDGCLAKELRLFVLGGWSADLTLGLGAVCAMTMGVPTYEDVAEAVRIGRIPREVARAAHRVDARDITVRALKMRDLAVLRLVPYCEFSHDSGDSSMPWASIPYAIPAVRARMVEAHIAIAKLMCGGGLVAATEEEMRKMEELAPQLTGDWSFHRMRAVLDYVRVYVAFGGTHAVLQSRRRRCGGVVVPFERFVRNDGDNAIGHNVARFLVG